MFEELPAVFFHDVAGEPDEAASPAEEEQEEVLEARAFRHLDLVTLNVPETDLGADPVTESTAPEEIEPSADDEFEIVTSGWVDES